jgi:hypothetical protein
MDSRITDTFTGSLGKRTGEEQKLVKTTALDLQMNLASPGMSFHILNHAWDERFGSVRVNLGRFVSRSTEWMSSVPQTGEVCSDGPEGIACWFIDTDYE